MPDVLVRADALTRLYGRGDGAFNAVRGASFEIARGERIALTGRSGSGKTTLLLLVAAIDAPTSGEIAWPAIGPADSLRPAEIGVAFQGPSLLPPLTVEENVALPLLLCGASEADARSAAARFIDRFALSDVATKLPEEISGGQAQRAALARALVTAPALVLADEPTGQQDSAGAVRTMDALLECVEASGAALLVATHDASVAARFELRWAIDAGTLRTEVAQRS